MVIRLPDKPQKSVFIYKAKLLERPHAIERVKLPAKKIKKDLLVTATDISLIISLIEVEPLHCERSLMYFVVARLE